MSVRRLACIPLLFAGVATAGINWTSVWLEPREPVVLSAGERQTYTVMGLNGANVQADLTKSQYLSITSSDPTVLEIDRENGVFIGKKAGHVDIRILYSDDVELVPAFVRSTPTGNPVGGVWKAAFTGDPGDWPKVASQIVFDLTANGNALSGAVHASYWPGDGAIVDGQVVGDRVSFTMRGHLPYTANGSQAYPKLCFSGVRTGDEMKLDVLWADASRPCESGKLYPMAGRKVAD